MHDLYILFLWNKAAQRRISMFTTIIKRDGRTAAYDVEKIAKAIFRAATSVGGKDYQTAQNLALQVEKRLEEKCAPSQSPTVEQIQDMVEKVLIENGHSRTAKEYILYRAQRTRVREMNTKLMKVYEDLTFKSAAENDIKRENANIDGNTAMGTMLKYGSEGAKAFYEMFVLDPEHASAHDCGDIHIHDLDFFSLTTTCCQIDLTKLFEGGFNSGYGYLREPGDIASYAALAYNAIQSNQNDQHGGQSVPKFDFDMAPGVRKTYQKNYCRCLANACELLCGISDCSKLLSEVFEPLKSDNLVPSMEQNEEYTAAEQKLLKEVLSCTDSEITAAQRFAAKHAYKETERATYQAMEALIHNLNTMHSRAGAQTPFSSLNYGTDTSPEGRMVIKNMLLAEQAGLGHGETPIFPIHIFKVKEGVNFNPSDPNYDLFRLACKVSAKRLFPNFSFLDAPFNLQYYKDGRPETEVAYMGCRTRVAANTYDPTREITTGRGNLSYTSINLPRLAILSNKNIDLFFDLLDRKIDLVIQQLLDRFRIQGQKKVLNFPFLMGQGVWLDSDKLSPNDEIAEVLKHGTLTIGFIGLAETLVALIGQHHGQSEYAQNLGLEIIGHMRARMDAESEKRKLNFSLIATPAEGLSGRFVKIDRERFGVIEGVTDRDYYTNSFHIPVYFDINAFEKIRLEAPYHALTNGGHITYVELDGDPLQNVDAFEQLIRCMKESGIGYGSINHPVDRDPVCGYTGIIGDECPNCHRKETADQPIERIRRITGYLVGSLEHFNNAKRAEEHDRVKHGL